MSTEEFKHLSPIFLYPVVAEEHALEALKLMKSTMTTGPDGFPSYLD